MKFIIRIKILYISILLVIISNAYLSSLRVITKDAFSFNDTTYSDSSFDELSINDDEQKVYLDKEGRGIMIKSFNGISDEKLKLVSEKLNPEIYLIDYRLMRNCVFKVKFIGEKGNILNIEFSPRSLEKRPKNHELKIQLDIKNYSKFFPDLDNKEESIINHIKEQCYKRKESLNLIKKEIINQINVYKERMHKMIDINSKYRSLKNTTEEFELTIKDVQSQITQIRRLKKSYENQKENLEQLMKSSKKLLKKEKVDTNVITNYIVKIKIKLKENSFKFKELRDKEVEIKNKYKNYILSQKDIEGEIINLSKRLSETDQQISSLSRNKLKENYEIHYIESSTKELYARIDEISKQIIKSINKKTENKNKTIFINKNKDDLDKKIQIEKKKIRNIDEQIDELILQKTKIEEQVKDQYTTIRAKEDELTSIDIENEQLNSNIKRLEDKLKSSKQNIENIKEKQTYLTQQNNNFQKKLSILNSTRNNLTVELEANEKSKVTILKKIRNLINFTENNNNETSILENIKFNLEKKISDNNIDLKEKEQNIRNLEREINNYKFDADNIIKTISTFEENKQNVEKILEELKMKILPNKEELIQFMMEKKQNEEILSKSKSKIISSIDILKNKIPELKIIADIIEDEFINSDENFDEKRFLNLVQRIIS